LRIVYINLLTIECKKSKKKVDELFARLDSSLAEHKNGIQCCEQQQTVVAPYPLP